MSVVKKQGKRAIAAVMAGSMAATSAAIPTMAMAEATNENKTVEVTESELNKIEGVKIDPKPAEQPKTEVPEVKEEKPVTADPVAPQDDQVATVADEKKPVEENKSEEVKSESTVKEVEKTPEVVQDTAAKEVAESEQEQTQQQIPNTAHEQDTETNLSKMMKVYETVANRSYNTTYKQHHYSEDMNTEKFIASIAEEARQIGQENDIYASVMIAQAILESGSGSSGLSQAPNNNLFGIKGAWIDEDGEAHSKSFATQEDDGSGNLYTIQSSFRVYDTTSDSLKDYAKLLTDTEDGMGNYYKNAWKSNTDSYEDACKALQGTYATDTEYAGKLMGLIETYDLTRFDEALDYEISGEIYDPESKEADENGYRQLTMDDYANLQGLVTAQLGTDYVWGGSNPEEGFDCSGLTSWSYKEALGIDTNRVAEDQSLKGENVKFEDLRMGDLLFFTGNTGVCHVAFYLGDGYYIHAPQQGDVVKITSMEEYKPDFAKRLISFKPVEDKEQEQTQPQENKEVIDAAKNLRDRLAKNVVYTVAKNANYLTYNMF